MSTSTSAPLPTRMRVLVDLPLGSPSSLRTLAISPINTSSSARRDNHPQAPHAVAAVPRSRPEGLRKQVALFTLSPLDDQIPGPITHSIDPEVSDCARGLPAVLRVRGLRPQHRPHAERQSDATRHNAHRPRATTTRPPGVRVSRSGALAPCHRTGVHGGPTGYRTRHARNASLARDRGRMRHDRGGSGRISPVGARARPRRHTALRPRPDRGRQTRHRWFRHRTDRRSPQRVTRPATPRRSRCIPPSCPALLVQREPPPGSGTVSVFVPQPPGRRPRACIEHSAVPDRRPRRHRRHAVPRPVEALAAGPDGQRRNVVDGV